MVFNGWYVMYDIILEKRENNYCEKKWDSSAFIGCSSHIQQEAVAYYI